MIKKILPFVLSAAFFMPAQIEAAPMSLSVNNADLRSTIVLVGKTGGLNVLVDDSVKGNVSISVTNVDPVKVLQIIATIKNLRLLHEADVYILTAEFQAEEPLQSYVIPIRFGDAETLRKAVYKILDIEPEKQRIESMKVKDSEGKERTYRYSYGKDNTNNWQTDENDNKDPRSKRVYVNPEVNALVLYGKPSEYERVKNLLAELDVELKQVSLEAQILAINRDEAKNLGVEWTWSTLDGTYSAQSGRSRSSESSNSYSNESSRGWSVELNGTQRGRTNESSYANIFNGSSLIRFGRSLTAAAGLNWALSAQINALVTDGKAKILSRPNVTTIQGREAVINVGSSVPVPRVDVSNSITTTSFEYRDAGIIMKYTPRINSDGTITATIHTEVSTPQYVADMKVYRFNTRSADTTVTVKDGEPMIIGGLIGAEESKSVSKIPFLGDLPILGALFRNHRKSKSESELIIFLTARVIGGKSNETLPDKP